LIIFILGSIAFSIPLVSAIPLIILHKNGSLTTRIETGKGYAIPMWRKYFFYIYYPLHLFLIYIIKLYYF